MASKDQKHKALFEFVARHLQSWDAGFRGDHSMRKVSIDADAPRHRMLITKDKRSCTVKYFLVTWIGMQDNTNTPGCFEYEHRFQVDVWFGFWDSTGKVPYITSYDPDSEEYHDPIHTWDLPETGKGLFDNILTAAEEDDLGKLGLITALGCDFECTVSGEELVASPIEAFTIGLEWLDEQAKEPVYHAKFETLI